MPSKLQRLREEVYSPSLPVLLDYRLDDRVLEHLDSFKSNPTYNTDGIVKCLPQPGHIRNQLFTSMLNTLSHLLNWCTLTHPYAETKSIGLQADAQLAAFFALRL